MLREDQTPIAGIKCSVKIRHQKLSLLPGSVVETHIMGIKCSVRIKHQVLGYQTPGGGLCRSEMYWISPGT